MYMVYNAVVKYFRKGDIIMDLSALKDSAFAALSKIINAIVAYINENLADLNEKFGIELL